MKKQIKTQTIIAYCLPQFAVGLFTTMINNYLLYFYQPSKESGIPTLITQGIVFLGIFTVIGLIKAVGHLLDAITDPIVAGISDKSKNKNGRRIPFMKRYAVPFGLTALLIFCAPQSHPGMINNIWIAVFIWAYYVFYTLYMIPHNALLPEMITDQGKLVNAYTYNSLFFVTGSALGYVTPAFVGMIKNAGQTPLMAWRIVFAIFTVIGIALLLVPAFTIKETDYVSSVRPTVSLFESLKHAFSNKHFVIVTVGQLLEGTAMAFFQSCIMYYVTTLLGLEETKSVLILATSIVGSLILYVPVNKLAKKYGKKPLMVSACIVFTVAEFVICFGADWAFPPMAKALGLAIFVSYPFAVLNILPGSMMADVIQYDTIKHGVNREGVFGAARSFVTKIGTSLAIMIVPSLTVIGATAGENIGRTGLKLTGLVGGLICLVAVIVFALYKEKEVLGVIKEKAEKENK